MKWMVKRENYHELGIGANSYQHLPKLENAIKDAKSIAKTLDESADRSYWLTVGQKGSSLEAALQPRCH